MKRHPALEPFSRDHNTGLILARSLQLKQESAEERARQAWDGELKDHFEEEERLLGPLAEPAMMKRMQDDHSRIAVLIQAMPSTMEELGQALHDHIRWEERVFFPALEASASAEDLANLTRETNLMEERRWAADSRRKELVQRRRK